MPTKLNKLDKLDEEYRIRHKYITLSTAYDMYFNIVGICNKTNINYIPTYKGGNISPILNPNLHYILASSLKELAYKDLKIRDKTLRKL